jgi:phage gp36-like protein
MYLTYDDLINGSYEETLAVLGRHKDNAAKAIEDAMGEVKAYIFKLYDIDKEYQQEGSSRCSFLVKIVRDIAIYNIYCISSPYQMSETRRLKYEDDIAFLETCFFAESLYT